MVNWFNRVMGRPDLGKLILRLAFSIMIIFHGWHKLIGGIYYIQGLLVQHGLPGVIGYGVFIGELVAPLLIILGIFTCPSALVFSFTILAAYLLIDPVKALMLTKVGGLGRRRYGSVFLCWAGHRLPWLRPLFGDEEFELALRPAG
jgi:putative oxidoreductase